MAGRGGNAMGAHFDTAPLGWEHVWPNLWCSGNVYIIARAPGHRHQRHRSWQSCSCLSTGLPVPC